MPIRFSLVVCTLNRKAEIRELFASFTAQHRGDFEVILVDQNTDDRLADIVSQFETEFPLRHIKMEGTGLSRARNLGIEHCTGELIGFPDDDCKYLIGYLEAVDRVFSSDESVNCIAGHPTDNDGPLSTDWAIDRQTLNSVTVLNRCQEFTVFVRRDAMKSIRYNELLGVGANTLWGADEGPDFLIRLINAGNRLDYFPNLKVYHPNKIATISRSTLARAKTYARGRGCLFRLHAFPATLILNSLFRAAGGSIVYLARLQFMRSAYYLSIFYGMLRGLLMTPNELRTVRAAATRPCRPIVPIILPALPNGPLVSVLIANFNYAQFLPACLDSLTAQTYARWEAVVCDDGSTDNSVDIVNGYVARDSRIRLLQKENGGQTSTVNACFPELHGDIIALLDADDCFEPQKIQRVVEAFAKNSTAGVCNHFANVIGIDGQPLGVTLNQKLDSGWLAETAAKRGACVYVPTTSCMSFRREIADRLFPVPTNQHRDVDGYLGMISQFLTPFTLIPEALSGYRVHGSNMGGLTEPTPARLQYELDLIALRTGTVKQVLATLVGNDLSDRVTMEENPQYIQAALKLLAMQQAESRRSRASKLIRLHPNAKWRALWRLIFAVPLFVSQLAIPAMHRSHRFKAFMHRLVERKKAVPI